MWISCLKHYSWSECIAASPCKNMCFLSNFLEPSVLNILDWHVSWVEHQIKWPLYILVSRRVKVMHIWLFWCLLTGSEINAKNLKYRVALWALPLFLSFPCCQWYVKYIHTNFFPEVLPASFIFSLGILTYCVLTGYWVYLLQWFDAGTLCYIFIFVIVFWIA